MVLRIYLRIVECLEVVTIVEMIDCLSIRHNLDMIQWMVISVVIRMNIGRNFCILCTVLNVNRICLINLLSQIDLSQNMDRNSHGLRVRVHSTHVLGSFCFCYLSTGSGNVVNTERLGSVFSIVTSLVKIHLKPPYVVKPWSVLRIDINRDPIRISSGQLRFL